MIHKVEKNVMHVLLKDINELEKFRFWYLNMNDVDLKAEYLIRYYNGLYFFPCVVTLDKNTKLFRGHQGVRKQGDSWWSYVESSPRKDYYRVPMTYYIGEFFKIFY